MLIASPPRISVSLQAIHPLKPVIFIDHRIPITGNVYPQKICNNLPGQRWGALLRTARRLRYRELLLRANHRNPGRILFSAAQTRNILHHHLENVRGLPSAGERRHDIAANRGCHGACVCFGNDERITCSYGCLPHRRLSADIPCSHHGPR